MRYSGARRCCPGFAALAMALGLVAVGAQRAAADRVAVESVAVEANGDIRLPADYRHWTMIGSWWFVMVRDSGDRLAGEHPLWGDGWGWAFFGADDPVNTSTRSWGECLACHEPVRAQSLIYLGGYPQLR